MGLGCHSLEAARLHAKYSHTEPVPVRGTTSESIENVTINR